MVPHEMAMPEDQAAALAARLLSLLAAKPQGGQRGMQAHYVQAEVKMGHGPNGQTARVIRFGPLQLALPLSATQLAALRTSPAESLDYGRYRRIRTRSCRGSELFRT